MGRQYDNLDPENRALVNVIKMILAVMCILLAKIHPRVFMLLAFLVICR